MSHYSHQYSAFQQSIPSVHAQGLRIRNTPRISMPQAFASEAAQCNPGRAYLMIHRMLHTHKANMYLRCQMQAR